MWSSKIKHRRKSDREASLAPPLTVPKHPAKIRVVFIEELTFSLLISRKYQLPVALMTLPNPDSLSMIKRTTLKV